MRQRQRQRSRLSEQAACWLTAVALVLLGVVVAAQEHAAKSTGQSEAGGETVVELRGRVVCLAEEMHRLYAADLPSNHEHVYGLRAADGTFYTLLRGKYSEAIFLDERLRQKELILKGRLFPKSHLFEVTRIHSIKDGQVNDLYYYCDVCSIKAIVPGPCMCCREPVVLVEKPLTDSKP